MNLPSPWLCFLFAFLIWAALKGYRYFREYLDQRRIDHARIVQTYVPLVTYDFSVSPSTSSGDHILLKGNAGIAVKPYNGQETAKRSIIPLIDEALAKWVVAHPKPEESQSIESYDAIKRVLTGINSSIAKVAQVAITTVVYLPKNKDKDGPIEKMEAAIKRRAKVEELKKKCAHDPELVALIERWQEGDEDLLDPTKL